MYWPRWLWKIRKYVFLHGICAEEVLFFNSSGVWQEFVFFMDHPAVRGCKNLQNNYAWPCSKDANDQALLMATHILFLPISWHFPSKWQEIFVIHLHQTLTPFHFCMPLSEKLCMFSETFPSWLLKRFFYQYGWQIYPHWTGGPIIHYQYTTVLPRMVPLLLYRW